MKFKKLFTISLLILTLTIIMMSVSTAGILPGGDKSPPVLFIGGNYDEAPTALFGVGINSGGNLWQFFNLEIGRYSEIDVKLAYLLGSESFKIGPIAGPNIEWQKTGEIDIDDIITYLTGAGGFLGSYRISKSFGFWAAIEYKFDFKKEDNSIFVDGYTYSFGLEFPLKL